MSTRREHPYLTTLARQLAVGKVDRREFLRTSCLLGMSAAASYAVAKQLTGVGIIPEARADLPVGGDLPIAARVQSVGFNFRDNFAGTPLGPMTLANKQIAFNDSAIINWLDLDPTGALRSIAQDTDGSYYMRTLYPQGQSGVGNQQCEMQFGVLPSPLPLNIEWDWMFEPGFDVIGVTGVGKLGPQLGWGPNLVSQMGVRQFLTWTNGTSKQYHSNIQLQNAKGINYVPPSPTGNSPNYITQLGIWSHFRLQLFGAYPNSWGAFWMDGVSLGKFGPFAQLTDDRICVSLSTFFGGMNTPRVDNYSRVKNVHIWTDPPQSLITRPQFDLS